MRILKELTATNVSSTDFLYERRNQERYIGEKPHKDGAALEDTEKYCKTKIYYNKP